MVVDARSGPLLITEWQEKTGKIEKKDFRKFDPACSYRQSFL